ncbi:hypothetical protein [Saccharibacillus kuerlensis]|uniref:DUF2802 domain-containing protein n=1 Tax=Saccharibacillus kuerlensis TaxID=459527 RepID=A0ABQ2KR59_9BACL|nr:hypothetical protein [Saccharibacillus kuerlensis]GGN90325.1 hypothetical protein GCM10010969_00700 [Saccharibacillus kuerlensis]
MNDAWLYVVLLGAAAVLYAFLIPKNKSGKQSASGSDSVVREVEQTLEQYMVEMEKENDDLVNLLVQIRQETGAKQLALQEQLAEMRSRLSEMERTSGKHEVRIEQLSSVEQAIPEVRTSQETAKRLKNELIEIAVEQEQLEPEVEPEDSVRSRYSQLFEMHDQGKSIDAIAKTTGMQRGEIQLILRLAKREDA